MFWVSSNEVLAVEKYESSGCSNLSYEEWEDVGETESSCMDSVAVDVGCN
jgi:hypothetical protein